MRSRLTSPIPLAAAAQSKMQQRPLSKGLKDDANSKGKDIGAPNLVITDTVTSSPSVGSRSSGHKSVFVGDRRTVQLKAKMDTDESEKKEDEGEVKVERVEREERERKRRGREIHNSSSGGGGGDRRETCVIS